MEDMTPGTGCLSGQNIIMRNFYVSLWQRRGCCLPHEKDRNCGRLKRSLCAFAMVLAALSAQAQTVTVNGVVYEAITDSTAKVAALEASAESSGEVNLESSVTIGGKKHTVTVLGKSLFENNTSVKKVALPENLAEIEDDAFYGASALESISIPKSVAKVGNSVFSECASLKNVVFEAGSEGNGQTITIGEELFCYCVQMESVELPWGVEELPYCTFTGCSSLREVILPETLKKIYEYVFEECDNLKEVNIPQSVEYIDASFLTNSSVAALNVAEGNVKYKSADGALLSADGTQFFFCLPRKTGTCVVPDGVKALEDYAFYAATELTGVTLPESLERIGSDVFLESGVKKLYIPKNVENIKNFTFAGSGLESIDVDGGNAAYSSKDGVLFSKDGKTLLCYPPLKKGEAYTIPDVVDSVCERALENPYVSQIKVNANIRNIDAMWCNGICKNLKSVEVDAGNPAYKSVDGAVFSKDGSTLVMYPTGRAGKCVIPEGTKTIGRRAVMGCKADSIVVPASVEEVESSAFSETAATHISVLGKSHIGAWAFYGSKVKSVYIPYVPLIATRAFQNCDSLKSITRFVVGNVENDAFFLSGKEFYDNCMLYVPKGMSGEFRGHSVWGRFKNIVEVDDATGIEGVKAAGRAGVSVSGGTISVDGIADGAPMKVYSADGAMVYGGAARQFTPATAGTYIVVAGDRTFKVLVK